MNTKLKYIVGMILGALFTIPLASSALSVFTVPQGGTASSSLTGILKGNGKNAIQTATPGTDYVVPSTLASYLSLSSWYATTTDGLDEGLTNLYFTNPRVLTYLDTLSKGYFFSTTSADAWDLTKSRWGTTSSDYWYTLQNKASSTLLGDNNKWTGGNIFAASTTIGNGTYSLTNDGNSTTTLLSSLIGNVGLGRVATTTSTYSAIIGNPTGGDAYLSFQTNNNSNRGLEYLLTDGTERGYVRWDSNEDLLVKGDAVRFYGYGGTENLTVSDLYNGVGVGSTTPYAKLSVTNSGTGPSFVVEDSASSDATPFMIDASGNVGVGTSTVLSKLHIADVSTLPAAEIGSFTLTTTNPKARLNFGVNTNSTMYSYIQSVENGILARPLSLQPIGGNVGIGTTSPSRLLSLSKFVTGENVGISLENTSTGVGDDSSIEFRVANLSTGRAKIRAVAPGGSNTELAFYTSNANATAAEAVRINNLGNLGIGTTSPYAKLSVQGIANQVLALFDVATSEFNSLFRINANGSVQNGFPSGTTTKQNMLSDPDNIASITAANYMATYSDDPSRLIMCGTAAGSNIHIRNNGFANASQLYIGTTAQTVTWTTLYNSVVVGRGCITAGGYHYVLYASTTNAAATAIRRSTAADWSTISTTANWATSTISGVALPTTAFLVGAEGGNIYIATTTNAVQKYTIATSTNTLTSSTYIPLTGANVLINNTRVNSNGIYVGFSAAPFTRKYTLSGTAVSGITNIGVAVPSATGPDMFATDRSLYGLYGNSTTLLSKVYGY